MFSTDQARVKRAKSYPMLSLNGPISKAAITNLAPDGHLREHRFVVIDIIANHDISLAGM
jgi:hypothetical protein